MATPRPKTFHATKAFNVGRHFFKAGDTAEEGQVLQHLLRFGDEFVTSVKTPIEGEPTDG